MDNIKDLTYDELIELYNIVKQYIGFLNGELKNYEEPEEEGK